mmetsp:Transcript_123066/g.342760  ORF Transcript_123066/g.342760 Transcript_123066/m.342760 type:complete len:213 (+) Transcript_123066:92-730(+)
MRMCVELPAGLATAGKGPCKELLLVWQLLQGLRILRGQLAPRPRSRVLPPCAPLVEMGALLRPGGVLLPDAAALRAASPGAETGRHDELGGTHFHHLASHVAGVAAVSACCSGYSWQGPQQSLLGRLHLRGQKHQALLLLCVLALLLCCRADLSVDRGEPGRGRPHAGAVLEVAGPALGALVSLVVLHAIYGIPPLVVARATPRVEVHWTLG